MSNTKLQQTIAERLKVLPVIYPKIEILTRVNFIKDFLIYSGRTTLVMGVSGGQDSTFTGRLCQIAVNELNEDGGNYRFIAVRLPYGVQADEEDAQLALQFIEPTETITYNIKPAVDAAMESLSAAGVEISDFAKGNRKARERMCVQYDIAAANNGLVVGTDHAAEAVTGFYTKFGDGAADITPIYGLTKGQGRRILEELGCPPRLYQKAPTADLEDLKPGLKDEDALGLSYEVDIDPYLQGNFIDPRKQELLEKQYLKTEHKRQGPVTIYDTWWK